MSDKEADLNVQAVSNPPEAQDNEIGEKHIQGDDVGLAVLHGSVSSIELAGPAAKRVLRKIDLNLLPLLCFTYLIQV